MNEADTVVSERQSLEKRSNVQDNPSGQTTDRGGEDHTQSASAQPPHRRFWHNRALLAVIGLVVLAIIIGGYIWWQHSNRYVSTDDAFISGRFFTVSPKVSGYISEVDVTDNQSVGAADKLVVIDPRDYQTALAQAEAQLEQSQSALPNIDAQLAAQQAQITQAEAQIADANASLKFAQEEDTRAQSLAHTGAGTVQAAQQNQSRLLQAKANLDRNQAALVAAQKQLAALQAQRISAKASIDQASAQRDQARLNLSYTVIKADEAGTVVQLTAAKGQLIQAGASLMTLVPRLKWVVANFRETQIDRMHPGQRVDITVDAYPGRVFKGHVDSIQSGSGTVFSLLPAENATGNYVKVVQRVPVKINFDEMPDVVLGPGMSVVPWVYVQ